MKKQSNPTTTNILLKCTTNPVSDPVTGSHYRIDHDTISSWDKRSRKFTAESFSFNNPLGLFPSPISYWGYMGAVDLAQHGYNADDIFSASLF
jgi:hypothetical protein